MKWIAAYYRSRGNLVSGSDAALGGHDAGNVSGADLVIYTSAIPDDNVELAAARSLSIPVLTRAEALGNIGDGFGSVIAVSGTHGKSTVTGMIAAALAPYKPAMHLGGTINGRMGATEGEVLVAEACEYKRNFLFIRPDLAVVLNVELDHTDCYKSQADVEEAFAEFVSQAETAIVPDAMSGILKPRAGGRQILVGSLGDYALIGCEQTKGGSRIAVKTPDGVFEGSIRLIGRHNATNAVYALAAAREYGADYDEIREGLKSFPGVDRRMQTVGETGGVTVVSDYAHHPTEIRASLAALKSAGYIRPLVVFQPHTYERLATLMPQFVAVLSGVSSVILPVFNARGAVGGVTSWDLSRNVTLSGGRSVCAESMAGAAEYVRAAAPHYDVIIVMGAGDNEKLLPLILDGAQNRT